MAAEIDDIRERWERLRVCNVCSKRFQSSREMKNHKTEDHSYWEVYSVWHYQKCKQSPGCQLLQRAYNYSTGKQKLLL